MKFDTKLIRVNGKECFYGMFRKKSARMLRVRAAQGESIKSVMDYEG